MLALAACGMSVPTDDAQAQTRPFSVAPVASFSSPWAMAIVPGTTFEAATTALVTERNGKLWLVNLKTGKRQAVSGVPAVYVDGQGGLGDVALHPQFNSNRRVYLSYVEREANGSSGAVLGYGTLEQYRGKQRLINFRAIWRQTPKAFGSGHFSHRIAFGPDGNLYLSSGDRQQFEPAQDLTGNLGKVLRLTAEGEPLASGPFGSSGIAREFFSIGHRNVLGLAFAPDGRLWANEMGPSGGDEFNLIEAGKNYGWPIVSNGSHYDGRDIPDHETRPEFQAPAQWWSETIAPAGLIVYTGALFPQWQGDALMGGLAGQSLLRLDLNGGTATKAERWPMGARIREVEQGPRGEVYLLEDNGRLLRLEPTP